MAALNAPSRAAQPARSQAIDGTVTGGVIGGDRRQLGGTPGKEVSEHRPADGDHDCRREDRLLSPFAMPSDIPMCGRATSDRLLQVGQVRPSRSATSAAVWKRWAGSLACSLAMRSHSQWGTSGMISRIGRGVSSATRFRTASGVGGAERRPAAHHRVQHAAEAEQVGAGIERLALGLLRRHVHRRAGDHSRLRQAGVVGRPGQAEVGDLDLLLDAAVPAGCCPA